MVRLFFRWKNNGVINVDCTSFAEIRLVSLIIGID